VRFSGTLQIQGPREHVWAVLTDPQAVAPCVPGFERLDVVDATHFRAAVRAGLGPVRGSFTFDAAWQELAAPDHARMTARGKTAGSGVTVDSSMDLTASADGGTDLAWSADVVVHGMIASVGARLLTGFVEKQTQQFFECIRARLEGESP
jgi:carbon monoxide dehydrogenase subunit G